MLLCATMAAVACAGSDATSKQASIGGATMEKDGTVVLRLRAEGEGGEVGDAQISYRPGDPQYQSILDHIGGLKPGEDKPVPPWPDK